MHGMAGPDNECDSLSFSDLLQKHPCDVDKIRHKNANLLKSSVVFLSFTTEIAVHIGCHLSHFELVKGNNVSAL